MRFFLALLLLCSTAYAATLAEQYTQLSPTVRQQYDLVALQLKPKLDSIEARIRTVARNQSVPVNTRLEKLTGVQDQLRAWVGNSLLKYTLLLPLRNTVQAQREALAAQLPFRVPYRDDQIVTQFNVRAAQPYPLGERIVTLVRGNTQRGGLTRGDKVMVYFKQGGPVLTSVYEVISSPGDSPETLLLQDELDPERFLGSAVLLVPQS